MTKSRIDEIDILKGIAIIAVLMIHTTSNAVVQLNKSSLSYIIFAVINRLSQFAVPAFIFASAMLLMYNYGDGCDWRLFYKKRLKNVLLPYAVWTIIYGAYLHIAHHVPLRSILTIKNILFGGMFYHLYFIVLIAQLYVLFPVLLYIYRLINKNTQTIVLSIIILQTMSVLLFKYVISRYYQNSSLLFITYISFIIAGMYIGENMHKLGEHYSKKLLNSFLVAVLFGYLFVDISLRAFANKHIDSNLYNIYYYAFALLASLFFLTLSTKILNYHALSGLLANTGKLSFGIYLSHPLFLDVANHFLNTGNQYLYDIYIIITFILIYAVSYLFAMIIKKQKIVGVAVVGK
ncbi:MULTISPECIES: acyltransferase [Thermoanaerobacterium]|uniref:Acyltransferase 3 n=2 Tax=Thermoanaerobacterium TaxID=28895 RepID=W9EIE2_9THEO|nr:MULTISPECIES: acyltransferase [Thermoanaerobacterium]AFK85394.1 acyltransferase 3 [Thermoanaerobacterium saccharolyticum JW/SL-YS485]ETO39459.1 acyltransferase 3 [Thermoanaerobacterium aotearoense SCUT27]